MLHDLSNKDSFRGFLSAHRAAIVLVLAVAFGLRLVLAIGFPRTAGDEPRYTGPAINIKAGRGFSSDIEPPYLPNEDTMPLYPLFITGVYAAFGESIAAVRATQSALDLITCLLVAFVAYQLAPRPFRQFAAMSALIIYGCLSWFTIFWTRYILTETLAIFLTVLAVTLSVIALRRKPAMWLVVGSICGLALLTRVDSVLLILAIGLFLAIEVARHYSRESIISLVLFCSAIPLVLAPWIARNYFSLHKFQPFCSEFVTPHGTYVPGGYVLWIRTWLVDQSYAKAYEPVLHPSLNSFDPRQLPDSSFDSPDERQEVSELITRFHQGGQFTPELDNEFRALAIRRIKYAPLRFFVWLPLQRITYIWLTGFATANRLHMWIRILLVLPILIGGALGLALFSPNRTIVGLILLIVIIRTLFFAFYSSEERYIVEAYPFMIAACGVTCAAFFQRIATFRTLRPDVRAD